MQRRSCASRRDSPEHAIVADQSNDVHLNAFVTRVSYTTSERIRGGSCIIIISSDTVLVRNCYERVYRLHNSAISRGRKRDCRAFQKR